MTDEHEQQKLVAQIKQTLDQSAEKLDSDTLAQLRAGRNRALAGKTVQSARPVWQHCAELVGWGSGDGKVPAAYLAASLAVVLVIGSFWFTRSGELQDISALGNLDLLTAAEEPEFYEQLDFYLWLENETES